MKRCDSMRVLMVGNDKSVHGGITTVINQFKNYNWNENDIVMKFISTYIEGAVIKKITFFLIAYIKIFLYLLIFRPEIIHIHMSYKGSFSRAYYIHKLCHIFKSKDIIHLHGSEFKKWYDECGNKKKEKIKKFLKECNRIIVLGRKWEKNILLIEPFAKTTIINNAVQIPEFKVKFSEERFNILFLGVLIKRKGIYDLLYAISRLNEDIDLNKIRFIIAGNGSEEEKLKEQARNLEIDKYIEFTGWIDLNKKDNLLRNSQLLVLPSYNEGLPMAILEAMSYGLPIVATNVGDICEAVINEKNGFIIKAGNIEDIVDKIKRFIYMDEEKWKEMSNESIKLIQKNFSSKNYFEKIISIYQSI